MRPVFLRRLHARGANCFSHYVPLHNSPAGLRYGRSCGTLSVTEDVAARLVRLPLHPAMDEGDVDYVVDVVLETLVNSAETHHSQSSVVFDRAKPVNRRSTNHA
jgi:dTDP-4-amino-4,6-dideoxygalactose transaminase